MKYNYIINGKITGTDGGKVAQYNGYSAEGIIILEERGDGNLIVSGKLTGVLDSNGVNSLDKVPENKREFGNGIEEIVVIGNDNRINYTRNLIDDKITLNINGVLGDKWEIGSGIISIVINNWMWRFFARSIGGSFNMTLNSKE